jgi:homoserine kinase
MSWRLSVPASSANLGPGFDALGLALDLTLTCRFRQAEALRIGATGLDSDLIPRDETNLIWQTALTVAHHVGKDLPFIDLAIENEIPLGKGLGSSAAALPISFWN